MKEKDTIQSYLPHNHESTGGKYGCILPRIVVSREDPLRSLTHYNGVLAWSLISNSSEYMVNGVGTIGGVCKSFDQTSRFVIQRPDWSMKCQVPLDRKTR
jgi:hypothetical protein